MSSARTYHTEDGGEDGPAHHHVGVDPPAVHHLQVVIETTHAYKQKHMQFFFLHEILNNVLFYPYYYF